MKNETEVPDVSQQYSAAHAAHYNGTKDLGQALELYLDIMAAHPNTQEAGFSRSQIRNIVKAVVPEQQLFDVQVDLTLARFKLEDPSHAREAGFGPLESGTPS